MADEKNIPLYVDPQILARDLSNSLSVASRSTTSPDDESQLRAASRRLGIPLETARTDPAATKQAVAQESFDATDYAKRFPTSAAYLANPDNALVARDDVEPLSAVEQAIRGQIDQNINGDLGSDLGRAATDRLMPEYAAERREREQVLRTEGFAAASALSRRQQQRRELLRATGSIGEIQQPEATPGNILSGLATGATTGFKSAKLGLAQQIGDLFGDNEERTEQYNRERGQLDFERQLATPEFDTNVARWTYGGFSSLAQTAPAVGLSITTGSPALGLSMMGLQTYGEAYGRYRGRDASRGMASLGAAGEASVEVLTEILPMRFAVDRLGKAGLTQFFAGFLGRDMAGEQIATLAQDAIDTAIANPTKTWNDYLAERPEAAIQTAFATLVQSGTLAAIGEGVGRLAGTIDREQYAADTANQNAQQLADLMTAAAASMTRQRDPQTFAQLVQGAAEDSGSSPTEIFIDARVLAPLLEAAGMTPEQLAQSLPSVQEQLEEALATDGAVAIPIGEATAAFAGSGLEQEVVRNARVSEDAWTAAEAEEGAQLLAQLEQDAQKVLAEQTEAQAWEDSSNAVFDTLMGELSNAGRFTPDVNRAYATLVRNFYAVQANKLGITPQEMYAQFPLTVTSRAPGQQQAQVLDQYASSVTPEAKPGALTVQGVHFSTARRATLDGRFFGTGLKGAERARLAGLPEDSPLRSRVLAYVDEGAGVRPEQGVGSVEHGVTMSNIYDTGKDPLGLWTGADANTREQAVLDAGFDGYYVPGVMAVGGGKTSGVVALLGEAAYNVPTTERAASAEAAAQVQSPLQAALDALDASNRLPAGQIAPSRLGELTERLEPELYATLAPTGMFEGTEPRYRADIIADARSSEVFNQAANPQARVMFEVAPDPNDEALTEQWNALSDAERLEISQQVAAQVVPKVLAELSTTGDFVMQLGGYLGATNPSMTLRLDRPELAVQAAKLLGHALAQDSMMVVTETQAIGTEPVGAVTISLPEGYGTNEVTALYDRLFELQENGEPLVGGHTTANGQMTILNYSPLSDDELARRINEHLGDEFQIHVDQVYSAFPQKSEYGYASDQQDGATAPGKSSAQRRPDRLRREATQLVREALAARAEPAATQAADATQEVAQPEVFNQSAQTDTVFVDGVERPATDSNGAPLSQTEEGIQAFWRWFGDSKIVDSQGRPLVVYHSSLEDKASFDKHGKFMGYTGVSGISVTDNPEMASRYLDRYAEFGWVDGKPNQPFQKNVMALYVRAENPLERDEPIKTNIPLGAPLPEGYVSEVEKRGYDALIRNDAISRKGGVKHSDAKNAIRGREIVVFEPTQIKSAIGNTGGFDPADPNILYQSVPQTETPAFKAWFGDSKVVDENGLPLVVYHGTGADIAQFNTEGRGKTAGSGSFFSSSPAIAATYATGESPNVTPAYLSLKAPVVVDAGGANWARLGRKVKVSMPAVEVSDQSDEDLLAELEERAPQKGVTKKLKAKTATLGKLFPGELVYDDDYASTDDLARWARAQGYDGIIIKNVMDHGPSGRFATDNRVSDIYVAFRPEQIKSAIGNTGGFDPADPSILNQPGQARATFNPSTLNIALLEKADLSSFLHETGHFFFEMQATLAAQPNAPAEIVADMQTLLDHVGYAGTAAEWLAQPLNARREAHETIAETFEQYLFEGKAPSAELQSVFRRFRSWLISVYRSLQQMLATNERASLNPEVAAVFDRMIATDEAIAAAQAVRQFEPLFRSAEDAGMEPEAWAEYQATLQEQQAEAIEELQARTLRDLKWLDNARGRKLKELQKAAQALRKAVRDEVTAEVNEQPIYKAMEFLKFGSLTDEDGSQIQIEVTKAAKLNITELERMYPEGELGTGVEWRKLGYGKYGMLSDAGLHPDTVAEMFGFRSGRQLVTELLNAEPKTSVIEGMTDQRMLERHGDISSPEAMAEAANEALANDARSRLVATELKAVTKATGSPAALTRAARQAAEQIVAAKPVRNLRPDLAAASAARARKAAEKAMASGDTAAAAQAKRTEILQVQLERAQRRTQQEHDKALAGFKKIFKGTNEKLAKSRDVAMVTAARAVLARYGLAPNTSAANAQAYQQLLENYDGAMAADIKSILQGLPPSVDFRDLTVEQFRGMRDVVNGLYYLSRRTRQMEIDGQKVDIDAIADELVAIVTERSGGTIPPLPGYTGTPTGLDKWKASLLSAKASLTRVEAWADNWGPAFKRYIWQPVSEATTVMRDKRNALVAQYRDLLKSIEKGITYNKIDAPELGPAGFVFNAGKSELLHAVLHSGNQSNLTKLLLGRGWGTLDANGQLDTRKWDQFITRMINEGVLTKADFDFAQGVWDLLETVKKDAQAAHKEMYGYYFNEVTADPINTPFGTYRGGYVPALADSLSSPDMAQKREQEELLHAGNSFMFPTTGKGFTQSRVFYNKPLELDLRAIGQHLDKVSRFAYLEPAIKDVAQLMGNKRVARALNGASPGAVSDMLTPWLQRTARQSASTPGKNPKMNRFFNGLRSRTGLLFMFGNIVNTLQQLTGFSLAALKVPAPKLLRATAGYLAHPLKMRQQVGERSPWLAERMANQSYAMQDQIDQILTNPNPYEQFTDFVRRHAYFLQQAMQNVMDPIIWTGAYDHATAQGATEKEARRYADETVRTTQGSFAPEDIAAFEVQSPFVRLFTQFYGYFNMWGNLIGNEANKAVREAGFVRASPRLMFIWFAGLAIPAFVAELISQGAPDDEDDEDGDGLLDEWLAMFFGSQAKSLATMIPIAGHGAVLVANQSDSRVWNDRLNVGPALSAGESAGKGLAAILTGEVFDEEFTKTEFRSLLTLLGLGTGLPVAPVARAGGYLFDVESGRKDPQSAAEMGIGIATGR